MNSATTPVAIIGGGWAGLSAAIELSRHNIPVTLVESNRQLGGRARTINIDGIDVDNGQHLMIGAYTETLRLLEVVGYEPAQLFVRQATLLQCRSASLPGFRLALARLPAPLHFIYGLFTASGFNYREKASIIRLCLALNASGFMLDTDCRLSSWLESNGQSGKLIHRFWKPLCLAILNTPIEIASSEVFLRVLKDSFTVKRAHSDFLFARDNLGHIFPEPARRYLEAKQSTVISGERVKKIKDIHGEGFSLHTDERVISATHLVLAVPPQQCLRLTTTLSKLESLQASLARFQSSPITTVYLHYPKRVSLGQAMLGVNGGLVEWLIDRRLSGQPGLIAGIISGPGPHTKLTKKELQNKIITEIKTLFPHWPAPDKITIVREKQATFMCENGVNTWRPKNKTNQKNLWLAGDYTDTGYPATLEGAVRSGVDCAKQILQAINA